MIITEHCKSRVESRLHGVVSLEEVEECTRGLAPKVGETWVLVKRLTEHKSIPAGTSEGWVNGDTIWAVVKRRHKNAAPIVVTVLLRRWDQRVNGDHRVV